MTRRSSQDPRRSLPWSASSQLLCGVAGSLTLRPQPVLIGPGSAVVGAASGAHVSCRRDSSCCFPGVCGSSCSPPTRSLRRSMRCCASRRSYRVSVGLSAAGSIRARAPCASPRRPSDGAMRYSLVVPERALPSDPLGAQQLRPGTGAGDGRTQSPRVREGGCVVRAELRLARASSEPLAHLGA